MLYSSYTNYPIWYTFQGINISPSKAFLKMSFRTSPGGICIHSLGGKFSGFTALRLMKNHAQSIKPPPEWVHPTSIPFGSSTHILDVDQGQTLPSELRFKCHGRTCGLMICWWPCTLAGDFSYLFEAGWLHAVCQFYAKCVQYLQSQSSSAALCTLKHGVV